MQLKPENPIMEKVEKKLCIYFCAVLNGAVQFGTE